MLEVGLGPWESWKSPGGQGSARTQGWDMDPFVPGSPRLQQSQELNRGTLVPGLEPPALPEERVETPGFDVCLQLIKRAA